MEQYLLLLLSLIQTQSLSVLVSFVDVQKKGEKNGLSVLVMDSRCCFGVYVLQAWWMQKAVD